MRTATLLARDRERLVGVHPDLVRVVERARIAMSFIVVEGLRSRERQAQLVAAGRSKTVNSRHLTGHAVDLAPWTDDGDGLVETGELKWTRDEMAPLVAVIKQAAASLGIAIIHGHDWGWDSPHHELDRRVYR